MIKKIINVVEQHPYLLKNEIQNYSWGTKDDDAFIPQLLGATLESGIPYAEMWMGTHANAPSKILVDETEQSLAEYINSDAASILGKKVAQRFNNKLPFLFKVLSIAEPLSIQTHPAKDQAELLHKSYPDNYPDDNHKPEIAIAIDKLEALAGFKSIEAAKNICIDYSELFEFIGTEIFSSIFENSESDDNQKLKQLYSAIVNKAVDKADDYQMLLETLRDRFLIETDNKEEQLFLELYERYNKDIGLLSILFLNYVVLNPGEAIYIRAGIPHAYLSGNIIECMANSDNVIRGGLTPKFVDVKNLLRVLSFESGGIDLLSPEKSGSKTEYKTDAEEFKVVRIEVAENEKVKINQKSRLSIFLLIEGTAELKWKKGNMKLTKGESIFIPADMRSFNIESDNALGYLATVNI